MSEIRIRTCATSVDFGRYLHTVALKVARLDFFGGDTSQV